MCVCVSVEDGRGEGGGGVGGEWGEGKGALPPVAGPDLLLKNYVAEYSHFLKKSMPFGKLGFNI